jgi:hypothetical protein
MSAALSFMGPHSCGAQHHAWVRAWARTRGAVLTDRWCYHAAHEVCGVIAQHRPYGLCMARMVCTEGALLWSWSMCAEGTQSCMRWTSEATWSSSGGCPPPLIGGQAAPSGACSPPSVLVRRCLTPRCLTTLDPRSLVSDQVSVDNSPVLEPAYRPAPLALQGLHSGRLCGLMRKGPGGGPELLRCPEGASAAACWPPQTGRASFPSGRASLGRA